MLLQCSATKAALDIYTRSLGLQLKAEIRVIEVFPPCVKTDLIDEIESASGVLITPEICAGRLIKGLQKGRSEIWLGVEANIFRFMD